MGLVIGENSFIDSGYADEYARGYYAAGNKKREAWLMAEEGAKEAALIAAAQSMKGAPYRGIVRRAGQPLPFPRCYDKNAYLPYEGEVVSNDYLNGAHVGEVPEDILKAQAEEAMEELFDGEESENRRAQYSAVRSYRIGSLSETFAAAPGPLIMVASMRARALLTPYVGGGYGLF